MKNKIAAALILSILVMSFAASSNIVNATPTPKVATPNINPDGGTYSSTQHVSIYCSTYGATIYYTTNGLTPSSSSAKYIGPITVSSSMTIKAIAIKSGWTTSNIASEIYTLKVATPELNPDGGTYSGTQHVSIYCDTNGATIYYTTNGNPPSSSSTKYTGPITVSSSITIKAIAYKNGWTTSNIASETYTIALPFQSFTLTMTGTARDVNTHKIVPVSLSMNGKADGTLRCVVTLNVKGGDLDVANYGDTSASYGSGLIACNHVSFYVIFTGKYGGHTACWFLDGKIKSASGNTLSITLNDDYAVLPLQGWPTLKDVDLKGTITLSY